MKSLINGIIIIGLIASASAFVRAAENQAPENPGDVHVYQSGKDLKWGPAPPVVPKGAEAVVLDGDPFKEGGAYTLRLKMPDGYKIPPHWHPTDENVTVLSGTLGAGMGDKMDTASGQLIKPGGFVRMPKTMHHYAWAEGPTTVQVHGDAPFAFTYVNPADDPRNQH
jgi:anti-sigma factor ChrR (cupin superfamily)